jgi:hypothetical protein
MAPVTWYNLAWAHLQLPRKERREARLQMPNCPVRVFCGALPSREVVGTMVTAVQACRSFSHFQPRTGATCGVIGSSPPSAIDAESELVATHGACCVQMYCTGGIRCDVYSSFLKQHGFNNLYSLKGGVQQYLGEVGAALWNGSLYVFDERMAVGPGHMDGAAAGGARGATLPAARPCAVCGATPQLPHINCANVDCNLLFLACAACKARLQGCCCEECRDQPPRLLRPMKDGAGQGDRMSLMSIACCLQCRGGGAFCCRMNRPCP